MFPLRYFIILIHQIVNIHGHPYGDTIFKANPGKRMSGEVIESSSIGVPSQCGILCLAHADCWSFNILMTDDDDDGLVCELNAGSLQPNIITDSRAVFYGE